MRVYVVVHDWQVGEVCHSTIVGVYKSEGGATEAMLKHADKYSEGDEIVRGERNVVIHHAGEHDKDEIYICAREVKE